MLELQNYLTTQLYTDKQEIEQVGRLIDDVIATLTTTFNESFGWPYQITTSGPEQMTDVSHSTTAMVAVALSTLLPLDTKPSVTVNRLPFSPKKSIQKDVEEKVIKGRRLLSRDICKKAKPALRSRTYGKNDPVTLRFISALCGRNLHVVRVKETDPWQKIRKLAVKRVGELCRVRNLSNPSELWEPASQENRPLPNAVIPLRVMQSLKLLGMRTPDLSQYRRYFEITLHEHLSFSSIPDSRFDPAELSFCLEGLLLAQREAVDASLFRRVLEVLGQAQKESAFWRPNKPFIATSKGLSLFPVSVEIANSLLRSCEIYDGDELFETFSSSAVGLFRRYWQWLRARTIRFRIGNVDYVGWSSEHVNDATVIHVWETSLVLEFLIAFRQHLQNHVARNTIILSRFNVKPVTLPSKPEKWSEIVAVYEPTICLGRHYEIYGRIGADYVEGWLKNDKLNYSMLLYGPPGTGKTTVAENLAKALRFRIINISVSDFLSGGSGEIEARAKSIFDVLNSQADCVVLLDEIDQLLLDRDGVRYRSQEGVFQFMTPGMLTKLNDLRAAERVLFIIATNYENRIDSAVKRAGRIDQKYLVLPPDRNSRRRILKKILDETPVDCAVNASKLAPTVWQKAVNASLFLAFKDIEGAIKGLMRSSVSTADGLIRALAERPRTTSLAMYEDRFSGAKTEKEAPPAEEFLCLLGMVLEDAQQAADAEIDGTLHHGALKAAANWFSADGKGNIKQAVSRVIPSINHVLQAKIIKTLESRL